VPPMVLAKASISLRDAANAMSPGER
jgi:hypothetical protein